MTTREELAKRADELIVAAFTTTLDVLQNKNAPPTARASATTSALKIHEILVGDGASDKEPSEMSYDELQSSIARLMKLRGDGEAGDGESDETDA